MKYVKIMENDVVNCMEGITVSLFMSGCPHHCKNCFNQETWNPNFGIEIEIDELCDKLNDLINAYDVHRDFSLLGGAVSYIECSNNVTNNKKAILQVMRFMYENILYSEFNFSNQGYCYECSYEGKLDIIDDDGKLLFQCPHCMNKNQKKLSFVGRLCGYIGEFANSISSNSTNATQGRIADLRARVYNI